MIFLTHLGFSSKLGQVIALVQLQLVQLQLVQL